ncbi:Hypothetical predicted protein [Marmota monax]|uniref:Uncharacterized protein n=1 Tax=Marmota monax TaxID=9995 RepID=A0A5E4C520_MARMO|nr:Hypothetical predicted protein [Marmota monax]
MSRRPALEWARGILLTTPQATSPQLSLFLLHQMQPVGKAGAGAGGAAVPSLVRREYDIRKGLSCDIIEPYPVKEGVMRRWQWVPMWVWLAGLGATETGGKLPVSGGEKRGWGTRDNAPKELETSPGPFSPHSTFFSHLPRLSQCSPLVGAQLTPEETKLSRESASASGTLLWTLAPSPELAPGSEPPLFIDRLDFFDYPDSDQASILAVAQFIGERPVVFVKSGSSPGLFNHILVGALVVAFLFLLFQFCTHM